MVFTLLLINPVKTGYFSKDEKSWKRGRVFGIAVIFICINDYPHEDVGHSLSVLPDAYGSRWSGVNEQG
jgi:hypothetical protein